MKRDAWEINSIDLDLDVIRSRSKGTFLDDEDEFAEHALSMGYPQKLQDSVRDTSEQLLESVAENSSPFNHAHRELWLAKVAGLPTA
jgi:protein associated with RNAse G/E